MLFKNFILTMFSMHHTPESHWAVVFHIEIVLGIDLLYVLIVGWS